MPRRASGCLRFALNHFDRIYSQPVFQTLMQQEMIRLRRGEVNALSPLVEKLFRAAWQNRVIRAGRVKAFAPAS